MLSRVLLACAVCVLTASSASAEPAVFFRGKKLTHRHYVYGEVSAAVRRAGTINLGYAHGLQEEQEVGVLRRTGGVLIPIGVLRLTAVRPADSYGEFDGELPIKRDDLVIVSARELNVWHGRSRSDQLVIDTLTKRNGRGYDTGEVSKALLNELGRDDRLVDRKPPALHDPSDVVLNVERQKFTAAEVRGTFRPAGSEDIGVPGLLSADDRVLSPDKPTLDLENALARFVNSNSAGKVDADYTALQTLAAELPGLVDPEELRIDIDLANTRIRKLIQPN